VTTGRTPEVDHIEQGIVAFESQREVLGDAVVDASIAALEKQLAEINKQPASPSQQRKLATILYADVVGSTNLSQSLEPDEVLEIMDRALKHLAAPVEAHGGHVARFQGDGFKAVFGVPVAHENDPEQAVRAGLEILEIAQDIAREWEGSLAIPNFQVRVGVNTGLVASGGETEADDTIMGRAVNLAARLESAAPPGGLLILHHTYRHVRGVFNVEPLEPLQAKGFDHPVEVYLVRSAKPRAFHVLTRGVEGVETRMVGRETELKYLQDALLTAIEEGEGQLVTVVGEAGVGKSRLVYEFQNWSELLPQEFWLFLGRAKLDTQYLPYTLLRDVFTFRFQIHDTDPLDVVRQKFEKGISRAFIERQSDLDQRTHYDQSKAHFLGQLLGFDFSDSPYLQDFLNDPKAIRNRGLINLGEYFASMCKQSPVVILLEDIHWADDSSLDAIRELGKYTQNQPLLIVCLTRQQLFERRPYWGEGEDYHCKIELQPLSKRESRQLVKEILRHVKKAPVHLHELVVKGAEGNPFYIEELIKMLIEQGVIIKGETDELGNESWHVIADRLDHVEIPSTLAGILHARLDSLHEDEKILLQQASVIGRIFWDRLIEHLSEQQRGKQNGRDMVKVLTSLRDKELIFRREETAIAGAVEYTFKHDITREVIYETVLVKERRRYHGLVADWLVENGKERVHEHLGLIGEHLKQAGRIGEAIETFQNAADAARNIYANQDSVYYLQQAISLHESEGIEDISPEVPLSLYENLGDILAYVREFDQARRAFQKAGDYKEVAQVIIQSKFKRKIANTYRDQSKFDLANSYYLSALEILGDEPGDLPQEWWHEWLQIHLDLILLNYWISDIQQIQNLITKTEKVIKKFGSNDQLVDYYMSLVRLSLRQERVRITDQTLGYARKAFDIIRSSGNLSNISEKQFGVGFCLLWYGNMQEAEETLQIALSQAEATGDLTLRVRCLIYLTILYRMQGEVEKVRDYIQLSLPLSQKTAMQEYIFVALANQAWLSWKDNRLEQAEKDFYQAIDILKQTEYHYSLEWLARLPLVSIHQKHQQLPEAIEHIRVVLSLKQQRLPDKLTETLEQAIHLWDKNLPDSAEERILHGLGLAQELGYL
jgi:class 3 adenylate cyclase/tetratricopeptide (TPR) repeat protein